MVNEGGDIGVELIDAAIDAALDRLVGGQREPARRKVEAIALIAGELRLWRVAGTNDSFRLTPTIFGPKMDGGYGASAHEVAGRRERPLWVEPSDPNVASRTAGIGAKSSSGRILAKVGNPPN